MGRRSRSTKEGTFLEHVLGRLKCSETLVCDLHCQQIGQFSGGVAAACTPAFSSVDLSVGKETLAGEESQPLWAHPSTTQSKSDSSHRYTDLVKKLDDASILA